MVSTEIKPKVDGEALKVAKVVLKRRDRNLAANAERAKTIQKLIKLRKSQPKLISAVNGDVLLRKRRRGNMDKENIIIAKKKQTIERRIPADADCLLVARNNRNADLPKAREALAKLGVIRHNDCRIVATTPKNIDHIRACDAYIFYGVPTPETISALVHKKAYLQTPREQRKANAERVNPSPLNNNAVIEDTLGQYGLVCVEDLVEVLIKGKDNLELFDKVSAFISSFKINKEINVTGSKFRNERATRGFQPKIDTIMARLI
jgi:large subunit ribosomal protein L7e